MFFRRSLFFFLFGLLLVFGLVGLRQQSNFAQGYAEGYAAAQQAFATEAGEATAETSGAEAGPVAPAQPYPHRHGWGFFPIFGIFGLFFKFFLMFIVFGFFMKLLGFGRHRRWHHQHWRGGGKHPYEKQPEDVEPDIRHA